MSMYLKMHTQPQLDFLLVELQILPDLTLLNLKFCQIGLSISQIKILTFLIQNFNNHEYSQSVTECIIILELYLKFKY